MIRNIKTWSTFVFITLLFLHVADAETFQVQTDADGICITNSVQYLVEADEEITAKDLFAGNLSGRFQPIHGEVFRSGLLRGAIWLKLEIAATEDWTGVLTLGQRIIEEVSLFQQDENGIVTELRSGSTLFLRDRSLPSANVAFPIRINKDARTIYLRLKSITPIVTGIYLHDEISWAGLQSFDTMLFGIYLFVLGIVLLICIYNVVVQRNVIFIFYVGHLIFFGLMMLTVFGYSDAYIWGVALNGAFWLPLMVSFGMVFLIELFVRLTQLRQRMPFAIRFFNWGKWLMVGLGLAWMFTSSSAIVLLMLSVVALIISGIVVLTLQSYRSGIESARFFLFGWFIFLVATFLYLIRFLGLADLDEFFNQLPYFASLFEFVFFLLALNRHADLLRERNLLSESLIQTYVGELNQLHNRVATLLEGKRSDDPVLTMQETVSGKSTINLCLLNPLTNRELEVLKAISQGMSNQQIAEALFISINTVKTHVLRIYGKLDVRNRTEAALKAERLNLVQINPK